MRAPLVIPCASLVCSLTQLDARNLDPAKPNVIFLYYDDMGFSDMGIYRTNPTNASLTPNLDTFAPEPYDLRRGTLPMPFALPPAMLT